MSNSFLPFSISDIVIYHYYTFTYAHTHTPIHTYITYIHSFFFSHTQDVPKSLYLLIVDLLVKSIFLVIS